MATKKHGRRAAEAKVKTPLTELTDILNANSAVFGRRAAVVAASGGLLTAAVLPAAGQEADDKASVSAEAENHKQVEFKNQTATVDAGAESSSKDGKKGASFGADVETVTAEAAPKPKPKPEPKPVETVEEEAPAPEPDTEPVADDSDDDANTGSSDSGDKDKSEGGDKGESKDSGSGDAGSIDGSKAEQVMGWAAKGVGTPYVYGGTSQSGWDCSGYTSWVYSKVGVNLPRSSGAQKAAGQVVSQSEAKPGDLIWHPGHVGIYAGDGQMYDAGSPGSGTSKRSYSWMGNVTFIRVL
ncbi:C40 family peptidase [Brevibacterium aurantiacum]|uniref:Cell wall-associated hydrolase, NlpC family n=2 Tax=Brevibacterium aurantiacum TaxID=273384 RepID=A0A1D7W6H7_BREAU|nr:C40 family peptidase [Brevibacterium aurantiacum]AOP54646.1 NLP/P60 family protein [Brevibacterium aurantiacum]AZT94367.1 NlpC/P60 family protein [Brevibacterium aurantiacum]AZT98139.1 NlpC/P60 family protein [Brevibacterium aurantiacum]MDN5659838.1 C40 family peptidase [Brevibacterium aurantiacum]RCS92226.1 NlpC/P60 family protein [Brevibacterium aurantiacum]